MRWLICVLGLSLGGYAVAQSSSRGIHADTNPAAEEEIRELEFHLVDLLVKGDPAYGPHLAEDYVLIGSDGNVHYKAEMVARFLARDPANRPEAMTPTDLQVRIYGDTAVMNFVLKLERTTNGRRETATARATKVFIRRGGQWYMVNNQGTPLPPK